VRIFLALISVAAIAIGFAGYWYYAPVETLGMVEGSASGGLKFLLGFAATIVGVMLGALYRRLRALQARGITNIPSARKFSKDVASSVDLWLGLVGAPIVYALLLKSSDGMDLLGLVIVALQNGFCCLIILNSLIRNTTAPAPASDTSATPK
jgi:hypothetical protein